jgi:hypothetical protein
VGVLVVLEIVHARSVLCHLAVRELGLTATALASRMDLTTTKLSVSHVGKFRMQKNE